MFSTVHTILCAICSLQECYITVWIQPQTGQLVLPKSLHIVDQLVWANKQWGVFC